MEVEVNDVKLYCEQHGAGKPLVLSHGWLDDCSIWQNQVGPFSADHRVVAYDHRGHGKSDKPQGDYSVKTLSNDLHALMISLKLEDATVVGFSLGAAAALICALTYPEQISRLVLAGATARFPSSMHFYNVLWRLLPYSTVIKYISRYKYYKPQQEFIADSIARAAAVPKRAAYACLGQFTRHYDIADKVSQIQIPVLIIAGDKDAMNLEASHLLHEKIASSTLRIFPDCGHSVMIEEPGRFNETVLGFVDERP